jgi:hypothetical protein
MPGHTHEDAVERRVRVERRVHRHLAVVNHRGVAPQVEFKSKFESRLSQFNFQHRSQARVTWGQRGVSCTAVP